VKWLRKEEKNDNEIVNLLSLIKILLVVVEYEKARRQSKRPSVKGI